MGPEMEYIQFVLLILLENSTKSVKKASNLLVSVQPYEPVDSISYTFPSAVAAQPCAETELPGPTIMKE